ncbi:MAG: short-chain dehydrogenase, partial [Acidimicrobiales bacterium]
QIGFTRVTVGDCAGGEGDSMTEFPNDWDHELAAEMGQIWVNHQYIGGTLLEVEELVNVLDNLLRCGSTAHIPAVAVVPRRLG